MFALRSAYAEIFMKKNVFGLSTAPWNQMGFTENVGRAYYMLNGQCKSRTTRSLVELPTEKCVQLT